MILSFLINLFHLLDILKQNIGLSLIITFIYKLIISTFFLVIFSAANFGYEIPNLFNKN